jgi:nucleoside-diphosphate-sugar epimerase
MNNWIVTTSERILITGANGFIGTHVLRVLLERGFSRIRCLVRSSKNGSELESLSLKYQGQVDILKGNLQSRTDCMKACDGVAVIYHLAVGATGKSFPGSVMNVVVPTRNLLDAAVRQPTLKRFVNVSSFAVYSNRNKVRRNVLDESGPLDERPQDRGDAYAYAKLKQDQLVADYGQRHGMEHVTLRPGTVYGPGKSGIPGRVGVDTFGFFMHLGGSNRIPLTYVTNCAEAIVLAGIVPGISSSVFNVVDDDLPTSRQFLRQYKRNVKPFFSIYLPHFLSYAFCWLWEKYSHWSQGQLPLIFSRGEWHAYWKQTRYSNEQLKRALGWTMRVPTAEGMKRYFAYCKQRDNHA